MQYLQLANPEPAAEQSVSVSTFKGFLPLAPRMKALVAAHAVGAVLVGVSVGSHGGSGDVAPYLFAFFCLLFSQVILLAFWVGVGSRRRAGTRRRGAGVLLSHGDVYLAWDLIAPPSGGDAVIAFAIISFVLFGGMVGVLAVAYRAFWSKLLGRRLDLGAHDAATGTQWSLKHLFAMTFGAALLLAMARLARSETHAAGEAIFILVVLSIPLTSLAAMWAVLFVGPVVARCAYALVAAAFFGITLAVACNAEGEATLWVAMGALVTGAVVIGSLLVVRSCGYRLVSKPIPLETT